jgi:hypothetical protein
VVLFSFTVLVFICLIFSVIVPFSLWYRVVHKFV